ncbi:MAG: immune inhibitor A [Saprospiraceae bacterium]|uniref:M14 family zinc carboxypeptidase n=1 Tax=Candidatus Brachybacter algidus TaxID=2982024 RepID=UPI0025797238|nr:M14 family zinc carboxypeptidase [Candidatus Brachybacter algidus]MBK7602159.1 immune inhibitor A [Candidatus Brachybacter algidus]
MFSNKSLFGIAFILMLSIISLSAQEIQNDYKLIKVDLRDINMSELAALGLEVDHGIHAQGRYWMNYLGENERNLLSSKHIKFTIPDPEELAAVRPREDVCPKPEQLEHPDPNNFRLGKMGGYYTLAEMNSILDSMHLLYPNLISSRIDISNFKTFEGRPIQYLRMSNQPNTVQNKPKILYTALHHAREPMGLTQLIYFMWDLLENYSKDPELKELLDNSELYFVPCINPDGYEYNYALKPNGGGMWRKNRHIDNPNDSQGVDLNRNYGLTWGYDDTGSSPTGNSDVYRGTAAFSEPETQAIAFLIDQYPFSLALNYHTYGNYLIHPWNHIDDPCPDDESFKNIGRTYAQQNKFAIGTAQETVGYKTNGGSDDWIYAHDAGQKVYSMTPELGLQEDGFWPAKSRIRDLAKTTLKGNQLWSKMAHRYFELSILDPLYLIKSTDNQIDILINRIGVEPGQVTLKVKVLSGNAQISKSIFNYSLNTNQKKIDSFTLNPDASAQIGSEIKVELKKEMGLINEFDTVTYIVQGSKISEVDYCDELSTIEPQGKWGLDTEFYYSAPSSFSDSPGNDYENESNSSMIFNKEYFIPTDGQSFLTFWTRWDIEANYDFAQVYAVTEEGKIPLCGKYTKSGNSLQDDSQPVYDGNNTQWLKEQMSLKDFAGQTIKIGVRFVSDELEARDGFFIDDVEVSTFSEVSAINEYNPTFNLNIYPNPASSVLNIEANQQNYSGQMIIRDILGKQVIGRKYDSSQLNSIDITLLSPGIYFLELTLTNGQKLIKKWVKG